MKIYRRILLLMILMVSASTAYGQLKLVPKEKLSDVASPRHSEDSTSFGFESKYIDAGILNESDPPKALSFAFTNIGHDTLQISQIRTTCSCLTAFSDRMQVAPGECAEIVARYNPKGHPGSFERKIFVYTEGNSRPAAVLRIAAKVETASELSEYPVQMGVLQLRRNEITFVKGRSSIETIRVINVGTRPLSLECEKMFLPPCITFGAEPEILQPGQKGELHIIYDPAKEGQNTNLKLMLKGLGVPPSQSTIKIRIE
jgi:hypothetical protein